VHRTTERLSDIVTLPAATHARTEAAAALGSALTVPLIGGPLARACERCFWTAEEGRGFGL
jgi:hypothetical protein